MSDPNIINEQFTLRIFGPIPYLDDEQAHEVWAAQMAESIDREIERMQVILSLLYPQMTVEIV